MAIIPEIAGQDAVEKYEKLRVSPATDKANGKKDSGLTRFSRSSASVFLTIFLRKQSLDEVLVETVTGLAKYKRGIEKQCLSNL